MTDDEPRIDLSEMFLGTMTESVFDQMIWWETRRLGDVVTYTKDGEPIYEVYVKWSEWNDARPGSMWTDYDDTGDE